jgi:hypothetical protein
LRGYRITKEGRRVLTVGLAGQYKEFIENPEQVFALHNAHEAELFQEEFTLAFLPFNDRDEWEPTARADVYIAGGLYYDALKKRGLGAPLVAIQMTGCDLYQTLIECRNRFHPRKIGILAPQVTLLGVESVLDAFMFDAQVYDLKDFAGRQPLLNQAAADGCDCILSSREICSLAEAMGIDNVSLRPRMDSFYHSLGKAKRAAVFARNGNDASRPQGLVLEQSLWGKPPVEQVDFSGQARNAESAASLDGDVVRRALAFPQSPEALEAQERAERARLLNIAATPYHHNVATTLLSQHRASPWYKNKRCEAIKVSSLV